MKKLILIVLFIPLLACANDKPRACLMVFDFIKQDLTNPKEADMSIFDCSETVNANLHTVLTKISAKNAFGVEKEYIYKVILNYKGGDKLEKSSWELISMRSEEYK